MNGENPFGSVAAPAIKELKDDGEKSFFFDNFY